MHGIIEKGNAVMDGPEGIKRDGRALVADCEIYNRKELCERHDIEAENDTELLFQLAALLGVDAALDELDGEYSFAYLEEGTVTLARDIIGVRQLWVASGDKFAFATEKFEDSVSLDPRKVLKYDISARKVSLTGRPFFNVEESTLPYDKIKEQTLRLLKESIKKRIPDKKLGLLFSGGLDSVLLAKLLKDMNVEFACYTAAVSDASAKGPEDLSYARKAAKELGLELKEIVVGMREFEATLKNVVPIIGDNSVVNAGIASTFWIACKKAKDDGVKVMLSGLGSEEIFADYERHRKASDINRECRSGLLGVYERDTYRDYVVAKRNSLDIRVPYLDSKLVGFALSIPGKYKVKGGMGKIVLRDIAKDLGISEELAMRRKKATQYGSNADKAIAKLAKLNNFKTKSEYLKEISR